MGLRFQPGDVVFRKFDRSPDSFLIATGQIFTRGPASPYHAGIASGPADIVEIGPDGIELGRVRYGDKLDVFRCLDRDVAARASAYSMVALMYAENISYREYGKKGAILSILSRTALRSDFSATAIIDRIMNKTYGFYCSSFVAFCYQCALEYRYSHTGSFVPDIKKAFKLEHYCYNPGYLYRRLQKSPAFQLYSNVRF